MIADQSGDLLLSHWQSRAERGGGRFLKQCDVGIGCCEQSGRSAMFRAIIFTMATPPKDHQKTTPSR